MDQLPDGIRHNPPEIAGMHVAARRPGAQFETRHAAYPEGNDWKPGFVERAVGCHDQIGFEPVSVLAHELGDLRTADLFLAFK